MTDGEKLLTPKQTDPFRFGTIDEVVLVYKNERLRKSSATDISYQASLSDGSYPSGLLDALRELAMRYFASSYP